MLALLFEQATEMIAEYEATVKEFRKVFDREGVLLVPAATDSYEQFREEYNQWLKRYRDELCPSVAKLVPNVAKPNFSMVTTLTRTRPD